MFNLCLQMRKIKHNLPASLGLDNIETQAISP
jgi:hypothetical protein